MPTLENRVVTGVETGVLTYRGCHSADMVYGHNRPHEDHWPEPREVVGEDEAVRGGAAEDVTAK